MLVEFPLNLFPLCPDSIWTNLVLHVISLLIQIHTKLSQDDHTNHTNGLDGLPEIFPAPTRASN